MEGALKTFFLSPRFAVAGASSDPSKFGHKLFVWYLSHQLPVTPLNPTCSRVEIPRQHKSFSTVPSPSALGEAAAQTSLSIVTPPKVTREILKDAKKAGIPAVWLQPGSFDREGLEYARREWPSAAIAGEDVPGSRGGEGWCVLVDGADAMKLAGRSSGGGSPTNL